MLLSLLVSSPFYDYCSETDCSNLIDDDEDGSSGHDHKERNGSGHHDIATASRQQQVLFPKVLPGALKAVRSLENSPEWLLDWAKEGAQRFASTSDEQMNTTIGRIDG